MGCHLHEEHGAAGTCRSCGLEFCDECLVYAFGDGKQPYCVDCAVSASAQNSWHERRATPALDLRSTEDVRGGAGRV